MRRHARPCGGEAPPPRELPRKGAAGPPPPERRRVRRDDALDAARERVDKLPRARVVRAGVQRDRAREAEGVDGELACGQEGCVCACVCVCVCVCVLGGA